MSVIFRSVNRLLSSHCLTKNRLFLRTMSSLITPPACVRGMKELNRELFKVNVTVPYLKLRSESVSKVMPILKNYILKLPHFKAIQSNENITLAYFDLDKVKSINDIPEKDRKTLLSYGQFCEDGELTLNYDNFSLVEVLKAIMPENMEVPTSYSRIGTIIHLNLRDFQLPYSKLIGQIYLDKNPTAKTVINKTSNIHSVYRFFEMEVIAGDNCTVATVKENKFSYTLDFAKVYWNPRLSTEHQTLTNMVQPEDVLYDVFAGIGPFAIPAAKKGATVLANDLNPDSYDWLQKNAKTNKVAGKMRMFNLDGREFIRRYVKDHLLERRRTEKKGQEHIAMNLPASAVEFLDVFQDWLDEEEAKLIYSKPLLIHVYCFVKLQNDENAVETAKAMVEERLGFELGEDLLKDVHFVRNVAPNKEMMRVSFLLMRNVMENGEPARKKLKFDDNQMIVVGNQGAIVGKDGAQTDATESKQKECLQTQGSADHES